MDAANRFTLGTQEFAKVLGPQAATTLDRPWAEIAAALKLDPQGAVANALAARTTWSGIIVHWPVENSNEPLPIEMSGLPVFDRDRQFTGYRGFGICRDVGRLAALAQRPTQAAPVEAESQEPATNVLAFAPPPAEETPALSPVERNAFQELGRQLSDRLKKTVAKNRRRASAGRFQRRASRTGGSPAARRAQRRRRARYP